MRPRTRKPTNACVNTGRQFLNRRSTKGEDVREYREVRGPLNALITSLRISSVHRFTRTKNPHVFWFGRRHNPPVAAWAFKKTRKGRKGRKDELSSKFETISRHGEDMEETKRMSTAATAAYQAAQVESRIWLSESSTRDSREGGWGRGVCEGSREGREPHLNTLA